jgi:hypothetical protein
MSDHENDKTSPRRRAEKKHGGGADRNDKSTESGVDNIAGTGGSSGTGSIRGSVNDLGELSGIDPELEEGDLPPPGTIGKGKGGGRTRQNSDGGMSGRTRGPDGETVPNQQGGKKGQQGQRDGHQSNKTQH